MGSGQSSCQIPESEAGGSVAKISQVEYLSFTISSFPPSPEPSSQYLHDLLVAMREYKSKL